LLLPSLLLHVSAPALIESTTAAARSLCTKLVQLLMKTLLTEALAVRDARS